MSVRRSIRSALAVSVLAIAVGALPAAAATPTPVARWTLTGNSAGNTGSSNALIFPVSPGNYESVPYGSGTRTVYYTGDAGGGGLVASLIPASAQKTYTIELRIRTTDVTDFNHLVGFSAGDDAAGGGWNPGPSDYPDCGLYLASGKLLFRCNGDYVTRSGRGIAADTWMTVRITRQERRKGADKIAIFVNRRCLGAFDDRKGYGRMTDHGHGAGAAFGIDDSTEVAPVWFAGITIWSTALQPTTCDIAR